LTNSEWSCRRMPGGVCSCSVRGVGAGVCADTMPGSAPETTVSPAQSIALAVMCAVTVIAGVYPEPFIRIATHSLALPAAILGR